MELLSQSLKDLIEMKSEIFEREINEPMDCIEYYITSHIMLEMCECVEYLHTRQPPVIHRDLKPGNILINDKPLDNRFLKLCDFGLATDHNRYGTESELHTNNVKTHKYIAPEVFGNNNNNGSDRLAYNEKSDIYSMGYILLDLFDVNRDNDFE
ncbi:putative mitogen-activated protein kinase kinase kinase 7-like [Oppia nitens]|uniref:putative mitogen-activated protein kinase kinase kinase 7-like n=1 Tax=Oppia nitens TaxID=1686743 RepID=UPI0023DA5A64|nr:putative mitogen-activated protein kinase kinase kinase 7-like [Oppia nitens]